MVGPGRHLRTVHEILFLFKLLYFTHRDKSGLLRGSSQIRVYGNVINIASTPRRTFQERAQIFWGVGGGGGGVTVFDLPTYRQSITPVAYTSQAAPCGYQVIYLGGGGRCMTPMASPLRTRLVRSFPCCLCLGYTYWGSCALDVANLFVVWARVPTTRD